ncbi:apolipophorins-like [Dendronephthya gigantea]|uniref:apolipophorins-like n=1 Tax=Dendronephthya gigantea TaxID=151771 RepID=UPI00106C5150|nr:apolipophorins-like [Dendronephthya gigantea]
MLYQDNKNSSMRMLNRLVEDTKKTWKNTRENITKFCEYTFAELRQLTQLRLTSLSASAKMAAQELKRMRQEVVHFCKVKYLALYNTTIEAKQIVYENLKMLPKRSEEIVEYLKKHVSRLMLTTKLRIEKLQSKAVRLNEDLVEIVEENRKEMERRIGTLFNSTDIKKFIDKYYNVEDLKNKTNEIKEDILNISFVRDLVEMGESYYMEGRRLINLVKESSEFALYVIKHIVKYSDLWEIVNEWTNPFYWMPPSNSIAMIFGKPHVHTFDGHSYQFVGYKKPSCTYVLAHDFRDNNFTLMSQETALIVNTNAGFIKIHESGKVEATVTKDVDGKEGSTTHYELPVEMKQMSVTREGSFIKIKHDTGLNIICDLRHFLCTFNIDKFYYGKLAGLLGTNNNEQYDELMKPDKTIAKSMAEFANAWEVTKDPECQVTDTEVKPTCGKTPSPRCAQLFMSASSPLARYFTTVDPKPFYDACRFDTSDCETDVPASKSFCNVTAAYTALLREKGVWARQLDECGSCGAKGAWQKWTEGGNNNVDVVLLIPETLNLQIHANNLPNFLKELQTDLSKYNSRYAVVGFGGKSDVLRRPHIVTGGGKIFGGIEDVKSAIANMKFTSGAANAFEAIEYLAHLPFLPGASKVVIMMTDQNREVMASPPLQKAIKDLDMQGVIFNVIGPYFQKKQHRDVLGLWKGKAMLKKDFSKERSRRSSIGLPSNVYTKLAESSQGGTFNLKAYSKELGDWTSLLKQAMKTTIGKQIDEDQSHCRQCVCVPSLMTEPVTICRTNKHARCS